MDTLRAAMPDDAAACGLQGVCVVPRQRIASAILDDLDDDRFMHRPGGRLSGVRPMLTTPQRYHA
jgi:hypothetical protein